MVTHNSKSFCLSVVVLLGIFIYSRLFGDFPLGDTPDRVGLNLSHTNILKHIEHLISIGNSKNVYEESRALSREYIRDALTRGGIPQEQILWNYFEWKEMRGSHNNLTTYTWRGINIVVWINKTEIRTQKVRVIGAHYDTYFWGANSTAGANNNLAGTSLLVETATALYRLQKQKMMDDATFKEIPYLFVFFDHSEAGAIGSKTFVEHFKVADKVNLIGYFVNVDGVGYKGSAPFLQTYPYEHNLQTYYSPRWLVNLFVQAGYRSGVPVNVGNARKARSLLFQAYRYHLLAVPYGGDDGPFAWRGVPTAFLTDYDYFFEGNPHHRQVTDQPQALGEAQIKDFIKVLDNFIIGSQSCPGFQLEEDPEPNSDIAPPLIFEILGTFVTGFDQYLQIGPVVLGFWELASLSFLMISLVYHTSVYKYRLVFPKDSFLEDESSSESESGDADNEGDGDTIIHHLANEDSGSNSHVYAPKKWRSYKVLIIHLALMGVAVFMDTVFAFQMLLLGVLALATIYLDVLYINVNTGFLCGVLCANFLYKDFHLIRKFGLRSGDVRELKLAFLLFIYLLHTFLLIIYGYDYRRKKARQNAQKPGHHKIE